MIFQICKIWMSCTWFMVDKKDNKYAYGGMSSAANFASLPNPTHAFQGEYIK